MKDGLPDPRNPRRLHLLLALIATGAFIWSALDPYGYFEWFFLAILGIIMLLVLVLTYRCFQFSTMTYVIVLIQLIALAVGAKHTYTEVPLFNYFREIFELSRNPFDRFCHVLQGFIPVFLFKELLFRKFKVKRTFFMNLTIVLGTLGVSAAYELLEFSLCVISGYSPSYILAPQGDIFDTQRDILMALYGALAAMLVFGRWHDRVMARMDDSGSAPLKIPSETPPENSRN